MLTFFTHSADETTALGYKIGKKLKKGDIIAMQGTLAAGKTTITKGIAQALDISEEITPHWLRHSKAMHLLQSGVNLVYIRDLLGHSDISTTMNIYAEATKELKEKEMEKFGENLQNSLSSLEETYQ